jgi:hypothetical protein
MDSPRRREFLVAAATLGVVASASAHAQTYGFPDLPPEGALNANGNLATRNHVIGPQNRT